MSDTTLTSDLAAEEAADDLEAVKRVGALSDGVVAIAITLLVLDLKLPDDNLIHSSSDLRHALAQWSVYQGYALSFFVIAIYWIGHWATFRRMRRIDTAALWLNMVFLAGIAFIPYPTSIISAHGKYTTAVVFYAGTLAAIGLVWTAFRWHAEQAGLFKHGPRNQEREPFFELLFTPVVFLASIVIALWNPSLAMYSWLLLLFDRRVHSLFRRLGLTSS